ncbi:MAG: MFS transporter [Okeania sp. SIO3B5]|uniref:hypothetical protein n=1 Tax=Okeania sp. SIO3B5 TaxID=2607811 RepID=UPI001400E338|nr:hypothetical protein [Okeania sp. SIO3B5]NEO57480.1 MFS transporter [Okeania sp. SIO3B5]
MNSLTRTLRKLKVSENTPEGFKMIVEDNQELFLIGYFIMNCFSYAIVFYFLGWLIYYLSNNLNIAFAICGVGFILSCLPLAVWCLRLYNRRKFENSGELLLSEYPLKLGGSYKIHYRRPLRSGATLNQNTCLKAVLRCSEVATYYIGTDQETARQIILEKPLINQRILPDTQEIEFKKSIEIPNNSPPSLQKDHNCILKKKK